MPKAPGYIVFVDSGTKYSEDKDVLRDSYGTPVLFAEKEDAAPWINMNDPEKVGFNRYTIEPLVRYRKPRTKKENNPQ